MSKNLDGDRGAELGALLALESVARGIAPAAVRYVMIGRFVADARASTRAAKSAAVAACNYAASEATETCRMKRRDRNETRLNEALAEMGLADCKVDLGGDPRGPCGRLIIPGRSGDGWGDGFAIY